jgi:hypothetical protein
MALGLACTFLIPETKGKSLEEISGQQSPVYSDKTQLLGEEKPNYS